MKAGWFQDRPRKRVAALSLSAGALLLLALALASRTGLDLLSTATSAGLDLGPHSEQSREPGWTGSGEQGAWAARGLPVPELDAAAKRAAAKRRSPAPGGLELQISGNDSVSTMELLHSIRIPDHPSRATIEEAVRKQLLSFYQARGYVDVQLDTVAASDSPPWKVRACVKEGSVYTLAAVDVEGVSAFSSQEIQQAYPEPGGAVDWPRLQRADSSLGQRYRDAGYMDAKVSAQSIKSTGGLEFRYRVTVEEGRLYHIGSIQIPPRLAQRSPFRTGDPFSPSLLARFLADSGLGLESAEVDRFPGNATVEIMVHDRQSAP